MNWLQKIAGDMPNVRDLDDGQLGKLRSQGIEAISYLRELPKMFPKAHFQTTLRQYDMVYHHGPKIAFMMFYDDIEADKKEKEKEKEKGFGEIFNLPSNFYDYAGVTTALGIQLEGFMKRSGYDEQTYRWLNGEWVGFNGEKWPWNNFESGENLARLVQWNLLYTKVDTEMAWRKYSKDPKIQGILESIDQYDVTVKDGEQMLLDVVRPSHDISAFLNGFRNWWWGRKSRDEFIDALKGTMGKAQEEMKREQEQSKSPSEDPYVYNISMKPIPEGKGKYIDMDLIEQAFDMYGDFNVLVQYHAARITYPASEIIGYRKTNDDRSFNFFNQNGGIRQMWIVP